MLIVDDHADSAEVLALHVESRGHRAAVAFNLSGALELAIKFKPDVALLDIWLGVESGLQLAVMLREVPGLERIRLVAVTALAFASDREDTKRAGFEAHLTKPVDPLTLFDVVERDWAELP